MPTESHDQKGGEFQNDHFNEGQSDELLGEEKVGPEHVEYGVGQEEEDEKPVVSIHTFANLEPEDLPGFAACIEDDEC